MKQLPSEGSESVALVRPQYTHYGGVDRPDELPSGGLLEYWRIIQRRRGTVILIACLGMVAGFLYTLPQTPVYQARTVIEVQGMNEDFMHMKDVNPTSGSTSYDPLIDLQTQVRILQSRALLARVVEKLDRENKPRPAAPDRWDNWRQALHLPSSKPVSSGRALISAAAGGLRVRAQANTRLIEILCDSTNPQVAADFGNALTAEFIEQNLEARWKTTEHTGEWLARQMEDLKIKLEKSEDAMQAYARQSGLTFTQEKENIAEQKLKQLQEELSKAQGERVNRQSRYELASRASADSLGEILDDISLKEIQGKLTDLRRQLAELSTAYTASYPKVARIRAQIAPLETALQQERGNILSRIRNDFESAQRRETLLAVDYAASAKLVNEQADKVTHYNILKREVDSYRQVYDSMLQRVKEAGIASALRASNIRVVDPAIPPGGPYKPSLTNNTVLGLLGGIFFGIVLVVFLERADRTIQEPGDLNAYVGVPELGIIPSFGVDPTRNRAALPVVAQSSANCMALVTLQAKRSAMAESFRATLTSILYSGQTGRHPQVIVLSSAAPHEGKTTLATNLAIALAEVHKRVLLIDGDLRRPRLHRIFELDNDQGLVNLLRQDQSIVAPLNGHVQNGTIPNLSVMTAGNTGSGDPTLLHSQRLAELLAIVRNDYDIILIDSPPMLTMADARVIARQTDGVILVTRANQTSRDAIKDACRRFAEDGTRVLGAVLNDWNPKKSSRYSYYRYYDKYKHYYAASSTEESGQQL
jgi:succinoglycan biosynthesis transport protein ExoP